MRLLSLLTLATALFVSLNLTGCVPPPPPGPYPGTPPGPSVNYYQKGYNDGCWTKRHAGARKNQYLYNHHYSYRNGWHKGYNQCKPGPKPGINYYQKGYNDGCWTKRHAGTRKKQHLYNKFQSYRNGWHKGYNQCKPLVKPMPMPIPKP